MKFSTTFSRVEMVSGCVTALALAVAAAGAAHAIHPALAALGIIVGAAALGVWLLAQFAPPQPVAAPEVIPPMSATEQAQWQQELVSAGLTQPAPVADRFFSDEPIDLASAFVDAPVAVKAKRVRSPRKPSAVKAPTVKDTRKPAAPRKPRAKKVGHTGVDSVAHSG